MNICIITTNMNAGGAQKATVELMNSFIKHGHQVTLILLENEIVFTIPKEVTIYKIQEKSPYLRGWIHKRFLAKKLYRIWCAVEKKNRFDLVLSRLPFTNEIVNLAKIPEVISIIDNTLSEEIKKLRNKNPIKAFKRREKYKKIYSNAKLIAVSKGVKEDLIHNLGCKAENIYFIYNPIDLDYITQLSKQTGAWIPDYKYIIHVARFIGQKRHDLMLDAWKKTKTNHILILLTDDVIRLRELVAQRDLISRCEVIQFSENPFPLIAHADLLVLTSDFEGFGLVLVEAALCKTPFISTDCAHGPREILDGKYLNHLIQLNDVNALKNKIESLLKKPKNPLNIDLKKYDSEIILKEYIDIANSKNAIFIKTKNIGDSIILTSSISALPDSYKHIDIVCLPQSKEIFEMHPRVRNVYTIPRGKKLIEKWSDYFDIIRQLKKNKYNLLIQFSNDWRGALISRLTTPLISIARKNHKRGKYWENSFNILAPRNSINRHEVESDVDLLRAANLFGSETAPPYIQVVPKKFLDKANLFLKSFSIGNKKIIFINVQSRWSFKRLNNEIVINTINLLKNKYKIILSGGPGDYELNKNIYESCLVKPIILNSDSIMYTAAIMKLSDLVLTVDSMTLHLASALNKKTLAIFGPTSEIVWGPWRTENKVFALNIKDDVVYKCRPCLSDGCGGSKISECLENIKPNQLTEEIERLFSKNSQW
ncbi:GT4_GT28_WabH-like domain containing protein [Candidatus Methylopumilus planktonicus]|uniref:glycosyltransferase n=1 Tax=Candidatus Methylopumilus planktonicus TaxID=1581557 RepID=UPI003BEF1AF9